MQDEVNEKTIALYIKTGKLTAQTLQKAMKAILSKGKKQLAKPPQGKQSLKQLMKQNAGVSNIEITEGNIKAFESTAKKYGIAPSSFRFGEGRYFRMGRKIGAVSFLEILAPELNDRILSDILDLETGVIVNLHIHSIDQTEAIKTIKRKITDLDKMKIEEQKKAVRSGYDMDIIPSDLATFGSEAKNLLQDLQSRNERMFLLTFLVVNMADTKRKLENDVFAAAGIAQKNNCALTRLDYQQEAGLMSSVPLGENLIPIQRGLTTSSTAIFMSLSIPRPLRRKLPLKIFTPVSISTTPKILRDTAFPFPTW